jgi:HK97 gp10 family phage protein
MADNGSVTTTGLEQLRAGIQRLPDDVTAALKTVALRSAKIVAGDAARTLLSQQKSDSHKLADAIEIVEDVEEKQMRVVSKPPSGQPANVTIWNEYGTSKMSARPYMRPAADRARADYTRQVEAAAVAVVRKALE